MQRGESAHSALQGAHGAAIICAGFPYTTLK